MAAGPSDKWVYRRPASAQYANVQARRRLQNANRGARGGSLSDPLVLIDADSTRGHGTGSYTTGSSSTPTAGSLLVAHVVYCTNGGGDPGVDITISDSGGHTWSEPVAQQRRQGSGTDWIGEAFFVADNSGTGTFTVTVDTSAGNIYAWEVQVVEVPGGSGASIGATGSVSGSGNGAVAITLSGSPATGSYVLAGLGTYETNDITLQISEGAGWTESVEAGRSVPNAQVQFRTGSTSTSVDWADNGTTVSGYLGLAFEIVAGGGSDLDIVAVLSVGIGLTGVATHDATAVAAVPGVAAPSASTTHDATAVGSLTATGLVVGIATRETTTLAAIPAGTTANAIASHDATGIAALAAAVAPAATITTSGDFDAVTIAAIGVTLAGIATHDATALGAVAAAGTPTAAVTHDTTATSALPAGSTSSATVTHGVAAGAAIPVALAPAAVTTLSATVVAYLAAAFPAAAITTAGRTITADLGAGVALVALVPETSGPVVVARFSERWRLPRAEIAHLPSAERWRQPEGMDG